MDFSDMIVWRVQKYGVLMSAVTYLLHKVVGYSEERWSIEHLIAPLNKLAGVSVGGDKEPFTEDVIKRTFQSNNQDCLVKCSTITIDNSLTGLLHIRLGRQGSHRDGEVAAYDFGLFKDLKSAKRAMNKLDKSTIISKSVFRIISCTTLPDQLTIALKDFAKRQKIDMANAAKRAVGHKATRKRNSMKQKGKKRITEEAVVTPQQMVRAEEGKKQTTGDIHIWREERHGLREDYLGGRRRESSQHHRPRVP